MSVRNGLSFMGTPPRVARADRPRETLRSAARRRSPGLECTKERRIAQKPGSRDTPKRSGRPERALSSLDPRQVLQDFRGMLRRIHLRVSRLDPSLGVDQVGNPAWILRRRAFGRPVGQSDLPVDIAEQGKLEVELLGERLVLRFRVEADPQDLAVLVLEFTGEIAEPATLGRSARRVG